MDHQYYINYFIFTITTMTTITITTMTTTTITEFYSLQSTVGYLVLYFHFHFTKFTSLW
ncbi:hypothetical protein BZA77DRAFT_302081 [Pyronema omphalodes]|nr:hypothetical protein BZA77DRAFT_302081 [Pyronema omphalodes]